MDDVIQTGRRTRGLDRGRWMMRVRIVTVAAFHTVG
jgi:hypothetical protein